MLANARYCSLMGSGCVVLLNVTNLILPVGVTSGGRERYDRSVFWFVCSNNSMALAGVLTCSACSAQGRLL